MYLKDGKNSFAVGLNIPVKACSRIGHVRAQGLLGVALVQLQPIEGGAGWRLAI